MIDRCWLTSALEMKKLTISLQLSTIWWFFRSGLEPLKLFICKLVTRLSSLNRIGLNSWWSYFFFFFWLKCYWLSTGGWEFKPTPKIDMKPIGNSKKKRKKKWPRHPQKWNNDKVWPKRKTFWNPTDETQKPSMVPTITEWNINQLKPFN